MCGIVGYVGKRSAISVLLDGLHHLEYRGYDSAGVAVIQDDAVITHRSVGKLNKLVEKIDRRKMTGTIGIGHTRWATHGRPSEANAHPHQQDNVILVHNGIIENYLDLRKKLTAKGHRFSSETDTEILCHLIAEHYKKKGTTLFDAMRAALKEVAGSYAIVVMDAEDDSKLYFARQGSPLVVGHGEDEMILASDIPALLPYTRHMSFLEDGDVGWVTATSLVIKNLQGKAITRKVARIDWDPVMAEKGGFKHFMLKEIYEQPKVVGDTIAGRISSKGVMLPELDVLFKSGRPDFDRIVCVACGTSWHAAGVARYWIEQLCGIPVSVDLASEFRYRDPVIGKKTLCIAISQSGETADTLAAAQMVRDQGGKVLAICNVQGSSLTRLASATLYTRAGPEIGVASTKAFTTQLTILWLFTLWLMRHQKRISQPALEREVSALKALPGVIQKVLNTHDEIKKLALEYVNVAPVLFIGRGSHYPVVLEGALKLKEIAYVHAEGFAAGELKHGPIALVDQGVPVIALLPDDETLEKIVSNIQEVMARGAMVLMVGNKDSFPDLANTRKIVMPKTSAHLTPILYVVPLQLFAYDIADARGTDIDQPRNLAKSVTVE